MKPFYKITLFVLLCVFFTACIDVEYKVKLNRDGSGTIEEKVLMSDEVIEMFQSFASMEDTTGSKSFNLFDEDELIKEASKMGEGVTYIRGEKITEEGKQGYIAYYKFEDINKIKIEQDPSDKVDVGMSVENEEDDEIYTFHFTKGNPAKLVINLPKEEDEEKESIDDDESETSEEVISDSTDENQMDDEMIELFRDFRIAVNLEVEGKITETNASHVDGNKITLIEMNFSELFDNKEKLEELKKVQPESLEETSELLKDLPGFKVELKEKVEVLFE